MKIINRKKIFSFLLMLQIFVYAGNQAFAEKSNLTQGTNKNSSEKSSSSVSHVKQSKQNLSETNKPSSVISGSDKIKQAEPLKAQNGLSVSNYNNESDKNKANKASNINNSQTTNSKLGKTPSKTVSKPDSTKTQSSSSLKNSEPTKQASTEISKSENSQEETIVQNTQDQNENSSNNFEFIKSNEFKENFLKDENLLLYGGIFLIIVSILGLFLTFMPKKRKKFKRN